METKSKFNNEVPNNETTIIEVPNNESTQQWYFFIVVEKEVPNNGTLCYFELLYLFLADLCIFGCILKCDKQAV